jgi:hypothetical protein
MTVLNELKRGLNEKFYENALVIEVSLLLHFKDKTGLEASGARATGIGQEEEPLISPITRMETGRDEDSTGQSPSAEISRNLLFRRRGRGPEPDPNYWTIEDAAPKVATTANQPFSKHALRSETTMSLKWLAQP